MVSIAAMALTACRANHIEPQVAGWSVLEPEQRHPILVSQRPSTLNVRAPRGAYGLNPTDRSRLDNFLARYRSTDAGNSKLVIASPSGTPNEVAAMQVVAEIRHLASEHGFSPANVHVEAYHGGNNPQPPVRISYLRYVAEGPECGDWSTNLGQTTANTGHPDLGCTTQRNFAAMIANPADLIGPRGQTGRSGERRDENWAKYRKGESTVADKKEDERVKVKGAK
ncbi:MAG TPA: CpaD family pilus assembly protein [Pirellulales bacterium]|nr:CpaD family pilus assembly protein [Pirellulales bacterium]